MTCIVGLVDKGIVCIGGDSLGVGGSDCTRRKDQKVFKNGAFIMGYTSSFRMGQLLRFNLSPPKHHPDQDVFEYMVKEFVEEVRRCLKAGGYSRINNNEESGGTFLVGYRGRLFNIQNDFQVGENLCGFDACGCGFPFALGALFESKDSGREIEDRVRSALEAAQEFSAGVREPFHFLKTEAA